VYNLNIVKKLLILLTLFLAACSGTATPTTTGSDPVTASPKDTAAPTVEPSPTPEALAATVNGASISLEQLEAEINRYEAAAVSLGRDLAAEGDYRTAVLDALIEKQLVLQAASDAGVSVPEADVQAAYDDIVSGLGGEPQFNDWLVANVYTADEFKAELRDGMIANAIQSQVVANVPLEAEQVHARQILVASKEEADRILGDLQAGADFATVAVEQSLDASRINGGDLGWFSVNGLTQPEVAQAAFAQEPEQISQPVQSALGFHIVQTLERGQRPLSSAALAELQAQAVEQWRAGLLANATIEKFVP
jgi:peptidyl-prolyl cis-trans isomerase C